MNIFPPELIDALAQPKVSVVHAVRLDWPDSVVRLHSGIGLFKHFPFDPNEVYTGTGSLGKIGDIQFGDGDNTTPSLTLEVSALDAETRTAVLKGGYQGRTGQIFIVVLSDLGEVLAWSLIFDGVMDTASMVQGSKNAVSLPLMSPDDALDAGLNWRCTDESHRANHPNDSMYMYTQYMEDLALYFGNKKDGIPLRDLKNG